MRSRGTATIIAKSSRSMEKKGGCEFGGWGVALVRANVNIKIHPSASLSGRPRLPACNVTFDTVARIVGHLLL